MRTESQEVRLDAETRQAQAFAPSESAILGMGGTWVLVGGGLGVGAGRQIKAAQMSPQPEPFPHLPGGTLPAPVSGPQ